MTPPPEAARSGLAFRFVFWEVPRRPMRHTLFFSITSFASFASFAGVAALLAAIACSNQGEGEFCDINAGVPGGDCQDGFQCVAAPGLETTSGGSRDRCCPVAGGVPTTTVCMANAVQFDGSTEVIDASSPDAAPATEAGSSLEASADATTQADVVTNDGTVGDGALDGATPAAEAGASRDASDAAHE